MSSNQPNARGQASSATAEPKARGANRSTKVAGKLKVLPDQPEPVVPVDKVEPPPPPKRVEGEGSGTAEESEEDEGDDEAEAEEESAEQEGEGTAARSELKTSDSKTLTSQAYQEFRQFLELGCMGMPVEGYPAIIIIVSTIPASVRIRCAAFPLVTHRASGIGLRSYPHTDPIHRFLGCH